MNVKQAPNQKTPDSAESAIRRQLSHGTEKTVPPFHKSAGIYQLVLEYNAPGSSDYYDILEQDLKVTGLDMFYGF